ncbi:hypothetical protein [Streptomyces sp. NPDC005125]
MPHAATVRRLLDHVDGDALGPSAHTCRPEPHHRRHPNHPRSGRPCGRAIAVDGKTVRGSRTQTATAIQLPAAMDHHG